jgi:hypothetical protein
VKKTVMLRDNAGSKEAAATFQAVEQEVRKVAVQWTVQVTAEPIEPPPGRLK